MFARYDKQTHRNHIIKIPGSQLDLTIFLPNICASNQQHTAKPTSDAEESAAAAKRASVFSIDELGPPVHGTKKTEPNTLMALWLHKAFFRGSDDYTEQRFVAHFPGTA